MEQSTLDKTLLEIKEGMGRVDANLKTHIEHDRGIHAALGSHENRIRALEDAALRQQTYLKAITVLLSGIVTLLLYGLRIWEAIEKMFVR